MVVINGTTGINTIQDNTVTSAKIVGGSVTNTDLQTPYRMVQMTPVDMTNGGANNLTFKDFTGIPSWVKRITVMFNGVSTNGTSNPLIQIGIGSITTSGYLGAGEQQNTHAAYTTGFGVPYTSAANTYYGSISISLFNQYTYSATGIIGTSASCGRTQGSVTLSGALDRVRITTVNGTDTFDAGSINVMYEG